MKPVQPDFVQPEAKKFWIEITPIRIVSVAGIATAIEASLEIRMVQAPVLAFADAIEDFRELIA